MRRRVCVLTLTRNSCSSAIGDSGSQSGEIQRGGGDGDDGEDPIGGDDEDEDDDDEDDTAELFRELEKIKRERAAEKARVEQVEAAATEAEQEARIATANPLLNLAAALGTPQGVNTTAPGTFAVKRRWDDGASLRTKRSLRRTGMTLK